MEDKEGMEEVLLAEKIQVKLTEVQHMQQDIWQKIWLLQGFQMRCWFK